MGREKYVIPLAKELHDSWPTLDRDFGPTQRVGGSAWRAAYQTHIADTYARQDVLIEPAMLPSYAQFAIELVEQLTAMREAGVRVEWTNDDPTPIDPKTGKISHRLMVEEYRETGILRVFRSPDDDHPILSRLFLTDGPRENMNSVFRAVHDFYGHLASGGGFGWKGETEAYYSHAQMFSVEARRALFCETVAQQCVYAITHDYAPQKCVWFDTQWFYPPLS